MRPDQTFYSMQPDPYAHLVHCEAVMHEMFDEIAPRIQRITPEWTPPAVVARLRHPAEKLVQSMKQHIDAVNCHIKHYDEQLEHADTMAAIVLRRQKAAALTVLRSDWSGILFEKRCLEQDLGDLEEAHALMNVYREQPIIGSKKRRRSPGAPQIHEVTEDGMNEDGMIVY